MPVVASHTHVVSNATKPRPEDADAQIRDDAYLAPFRDALRYRMEHYLRSKENIERNHGSLVAFAEGYRVCLHHVQKLSNL